MWFALRLEAFELLWARRYSSIQLGVNIVLCFRLEGIRISQGLKAIGNTWKYLSNSQVIEWFVIGWKLFRFLSSEKQLDGCYCFEFL